MSNPIYRRLSDMFKTRKPSKKIENNTYAYRYMAQWPHRSEPQDTIAVILHYTAIVYHCRDASAAFNHPRADSKTTRDRMKTYQTSNPSFDKGNLSGYGLTIAELPREGCAPSTKSPVKGVWVATDLTTTYVVENFAGRCTIWQPSSNGPVPYEVRTDNASIDHALKAMCQDVWDRFGELSLVGDVVSFGDASLVAKNIARAAKLFLDGAKPDAVVDALVFRRKRPAGLKGRLSKRVQAVGAARRLADMIANNSDSYYAVLEFTLARQLLGETHLVKRGTGESVPLNLDEPEKQDTWALLAARKHRSKAHEQVVPKTGEAGDDTRLRGNAGRVEALAGQAG